MTNEAESGPALDLHPADPTAVPAQADHSHLRFSRGYVLHTSDQYPDVPNFWKAQSFAGRTFRWDPRISMALATYRDEEVLICGLALDPHLESTNLGEIAQHLRAALSTSRQHYLDVLEDMFGQYVVFDQKDGQVRVQSDAIGSRAVFYDRYTKLIASHAGLVGITLASPPSYYAQWVGNSRTNDFPGRSTPYDHVWQLTPNTELSIPSGQVTRVGPRPFTPLSVREATDALVPLIEKQVSILLETQRQIVISASAGVDSRTSLAAFSRWGGHKNVQAFTYTSAPGRGAQSRELHRDKLAATISENLEIDHTMLDLHAADKPPEGYLKALRDSHYRRSSTVVSWAYHSRLPHDSIHIRGQINGVGKWHFAQHLHFAESMELSALRMASLTKRGKSAKRPLDDTWWQPGESAFQEYIDTTKLRTVPTGYRIPDMFLWEHRVSNWNYAHIVESDTTFDTYQLFGSRRTLRLLLSVPEIDRVQLALFRRIIERLSPTLLEYPLNGEPWTPPTHDQPLSAYQRGTTRIDTKNAELQTKIVRMQSQLKERSAEIVRIKRELDQVQETATRLRQQIHGTPKANAEHTRGNARQLRRQLDRELRDELHHLLKSEWNTKGKTPSGKARITELLELAEPRHVSPSMVRRYVANGMSMTSAVSWKRQLISHSEASLFAKAPIIWKVNSKREGYKFVDALGVRRPALHSPHAQTLDAYSPTYPGALKPTAGAGANGVYLLMSDDHIYHVKTGARFSSWQEAKSHARGLIDSGRVRHDAWLSEELVLGDHKTLAPAVDLKFYAFYGEIALVTEIQRYPKMVWDYWAKPGERIKPPGNWKRALFKGNGPSDDDFETVKHISRSIPYPFVRIDMIKGEHGILFGEFTPRPGSAMGLSSNWDRLMGEAWFRAEQRLQDDLLVSGKDFTAFLRSTGLKTD